MPSTPLPPDPARRRTTSRWATATVLVAGLAITGAHGSAYAEDDPVPSEADVRAAQEAAAATGRDVAAVRAHLIRANLRLDDAADAAAQAAEEWNGARWRAEQARTDADAASDAADAARADVERQRELYADTVVTSYEQSTQLEGISAVVEADGIDALLDRSITLGNTSEALDNQYDSFRASSAVAEVTASTATAAAERAEAAETAAQEAYDAAASAQARAGQQADTIATTKSALLVELADLQGISVRLAEKRQKALEEEAARAAEIAAQEQAEQEAQEQAEQQEQSTTPTPTSTSRPSPTSKPSPTPTVTPTPTPAPVPTPTPTATPTPTPTATPTATPTPTPVPSSAGGAAAVAFATAQLGEPYRWGAAGPDAWDCSGLTAGAWAAAGRTLPHYSVAQYAQSTQLTASQLAPGDLVFWGSSSDPGSIYHVALYVGNGQVIHAPRTGRPVSQESMYAWRAPTFFARP